MALICLCLHQCLILVYIPQYFINILYIFYILGNHNGRKLEMKIADHKNKTSSITFWIKYSLCNTACFQRNIWLSVEMRWTLMLFMYLKVDRKIRNFEKKKCTLKNYEKYQHSFSKGMHNITFCWKRIWLTA